MCCDCLVEPSLSSARKNNPSVVTVCSDYIVAIAKLAASAVCVEQGETCKNLKNSSTVQFIYEHDVELDQAKHTCGFDSTIPLDVIPDIECA